MIPTPELALCAAKARWHLALTHGETRYGIYVSDNKTAIHKGFFGPCSEGDKCANMDVCIKGRCMSVIHNGTRALCERYAPFTRSLCIKIKPTGIHTLTVLQT